MTEIYIYLLEEGTDVCRPVMAEHIREGVYRIASENAHPEDEKREFTTGDLVRCRMQELSEGEFLVAYERAACRRGPLRFERIVDIGS